MAPVFYLLFSTRISILRRRFFFPVNGKPNCISYLDTLATPTRNVVIRHLIVSAQILSTGGKVCNCLFHPSVRVASHQRFADEIAKELKWVQEHFDSEFKIQAEKEYDLIQPEKSEKQPLDTLLLTIKALIASE